MNDLTITKLATTDAADVRGMLAADSADYRQYFLAFGDDDRIADALARARRDQYWGIRSNGALIGLMMLRGFDEGYAVPAFGVYVARSHGGKGIARLALRFAISWCRLNHCDEIMLSVHPSHAEALRIYEGCGFQFAGETSAIGHRIYRRKLS